jgi:hypothetical protein
VLGGSGAGLQSRPWACWWSVAPRCESATITTTPLTFPAIAASPGCRGSTWLGEQGADGLGPGKFGAADTSRRGGGSAPISASAIEGEGRNPTSRGRLYVLGISDGLGEKHALFRPQTQFSGEVGPVTVMEPCRQPLGGGVQVHIACDEACINEVV